MHRMIAVMLVGLLLSSTATLAEETPAVSGPAPDWTLTTSAGQPIVLSEAVAERPVILFFWATWCPFCKALMPHLQSIQLEYAVDVQILALHFRDDDGDPEAYIRRSGYDFTLLRDVDDVAGSYDIWATPGLILVDPAMNIRFNLYELPRIKLPDNGKKLSHKERAAILAPYWAAELRQALRAVLEEQAE